MVAEMSKRRVVYQVNAERVGRQWGLTVVGVPGAVSLVRNLAGVERHAREAIAFVLAVPADSFEVRLAGFRLPGQVETELAEARSLAADADQMQRQAAERLRAAVAKLKDDGLSGSDIARVLDVSPQRVSQLLAAG
jgi:DNA-directed RNA polymerase specialized sigma24 family protein